MVDPFPHAVLILQNPSPTFINFGFMSCCFPGSTAIMLGYQGSDSENAYDFLNFFFFQSDRPTRYQETHSTVNKKKKKKGDGLICFSFKMDQLVVRCRYFYIQVT